MTEKKFEDIKKDWDKMSDSIRWQWVKDAQGLGIVVNLDNDATFVTHPDIDDDYMEFDEFIGWKDGVQILLESISIKAECV